MKRSILFLALLSLLFISGLSAQQLNVKGEQKTWHKITLWIEGPQTSEYAEINPFLDYRLEVTFSKGNRSITVPGYFAADGDAAETGASEGRMWAVHFRPDEAGEWSYEVSFYKAKNIAIGENTAEPEALGANGKTGSLSIKDSDKSFPDFRARGRIIHDGHYFRFPDGKLFLKGGADSPENFLAYTDFDQTYRYGKNAINREGEANPKDMVHRFEPHVKDWKTGDPVWQENKGKGIIGAVNYLHSKGVNSVYMLTMNIQGDGKDVWPYTDHNERYRFDCSKLAQWEIVFDHMESLGMMMHFVLQETENEVLLDGGHTAAQRKLYLRELIARFGHHLGVEWNIGEENGPTEWSPVGQTEQMKRDMANYLKETNPYPSLVVLHTHANSAKQDEYLIPLLDLESLDGPSMQIGNPFNIHERIKKFVTMSADSGRKWIVCLDELGPAWKGIMPDSHDPQHDTVRHHALWGAMMAGAAGVEWYFGYRFPHNDLNLENFRSRENWWDQTRICLDLFRDLPVENMNSADELVSWDEAYCFADKGNTYVIYLPEASKYINLDLSGTGNKEFSVSWYNPRTGGEMQKGTVKKLKGNTKAEIGFPPVDVNEDWVVVVEEEDHRP